jgi:hypothetical protein
MYKGKFNSDELDSKIGYSPTKLFLRFSYRKDAPKNEWTKVQKRIEETRKGATEDGTSLHQFFQSQLGLTVTKFNYPSAIEYLGDEVFVDLLIPSLFKSIRKPSFKLIATGTRKNIDDLFDVPTLDTIDHFVLTGEIKEEQKRVYQ